MRSRLNHFETIARASLSFSQWAIGAQPALDTLLLHAFEARNIHPALPVKVKKLFDDGHYAEATFHAFKYLDKRVQKHSGLDASGYPLMMAAFDDAKPRVRLTPLNSESEKNEQKGYRFVFAGGVQAIRNPRGHEYAVVDDPDICLDHLSFVSMLLRRLEAAGYR